MPEPIRILHLEDSGTDAELVSSVLAKEGLKCEITRADSREAFQTALHGNGWDVILADYSLPSFDGISALTLAREIMPEVPFIFVSGSIGEEVAIDTIKKGATDYVLKQRLARLLPSVRRALKDVEERHERKRLQSIVLQSEKMAAMGHLAAGVAHELNNPLTGILGFVQLLSKSEGLSLQQRKDVDSIQAQGRRCREIIQNLLQFSRKKVPKKEALQIGALVDSVLRLVQYDFSASGIDIEKRIPESLPSVFGDASQLQQVLLNLMFNAKEAMVGRRPAHLLIQADAENQMLAIRIKDSGRGIPKENLGKIFDLFFTTKPPGEGTGLGLSIVFGLIQEHGGTTEVESEEGVGTTIILRLPIRAAVPAGGL
jgi:signal transduction histidine kinase